MEPMTLPLDCEFSSLSIDCNDDDVHQIGRAETPEMKEPWATTSSSSTQVNQSGPCVNQPLKPTPPTKTVRITGGVLRRKKVVEEELEYDKEPAKLPIDESDAKFGAGTLSYHRHDRLFGYKRSQKLIQLDFDGSTRVASETMRADQVKQSDLHHQYHGSRVRYTSYNPFQTSALEKKIVYLMIALPILLWVAYEVLSIFLKLTFVRRLIHSSTVPLIPEKFLKSPVQWTIYQIIKSVLILPDGASGIKEIYDFIVLLCSRHLLVGYVCWTFSLFGLAIYVHMNRRPLSTRVHEYEVDLMVLANLMAPINVTLQKNDLKKRLEILRSRLSGCAHNLFDFAVDRNCARPTIEVRIAQVMHLIRIQSDEELDDEVHLNF
jgi:hypothetical protein